MTAPVVNRLGELAPDLRVTIRTATPHAKLIEHFHVPFEHVAMPLDLGMAMTDALSVDRDASYAYYRSLHSRWPEVVAGAADDLAALEPTLLLGNIPYVSLAAAARIGVPAVAMCCLHWADIFRHYCHDRGDARVIEGQIREAYASAAVFLAPAPSMPMPDLPNVSAIGPLARVGRDRAAAIRRTLGLPESTRLALMSLGGVPFSVDIGRWPRLPGWCVLAGMAVAGEHPDVVSIDRLDLPYIDVFASADVIITKLGYGTVAEAAVNARPVLYVPRDGWPEEPCLEQWLGEHGRCMCMPVAVLMSGTFAPTMEALVAIAAPPSPPPSGTEEAARHLERLIAGTTAASH